MALPKTSMKRRAVWDLDANRELTFSQQQFTQKFQTTIPTVSLIKKIQHFSKHFYKGFAHPQFCSQSRYIAVRTHMLCWECIRGVYLWSRGQATSPQTPSAQLHKFGSCHLMHVTLPSSAESKRAYTRPSVIQPFFLSYSK